MQEFYRWVHQWIVILMHYMHYNINVMKDLIYHSEGRERREGTLHEKRAATHAENFAFKSINAGFTFSQSSYDTTLSTDTHFESSMGGVHGKFIHIFPYVPRSSTRVLTLSSNL